MSDWTRCCQRPADERTIAGWFRRDPAAGLVLAYGFGGVRA
jgi:hypothetical protein